MLYPLVERGKRMSVIRFNSIDYIIVTNFEINNFHKYPLTMVIVLKL